VSITRRLTGNDHQFVSLRHAADDSRR
jgi:hypothetical protein